MNETVNETGSEAAAPWAPRATVDLDAIVRNARFLRSKVPASTGLLAAVKANAYGHGLVPVARALEADGVAWFGVATADEASTLRRAGIRGRILMFGPLRGDALARALAADADLTVCDEADLDAIDGACTDATHGDVARSPARVHLKIDTGMARLGRPPDDVVRIADRIAASGPRFEAVWTHFARADEPSSDATRRQLERFHHALGALERAGHAPAMRHAANSAAILAHPDAHFDLVRPGIALYGYPPGPELTEVSDGLEPALTLDAPVVFVKRVAAGEPVSYGHRWSAPSDTTVATVRIGYADGYPRALTNLGHAQVNGRRARVVGTVCMDQVLLDLSDSAVAVGDRAVMLSARGARADELAARIGTIPYELLVRLSDRVERSYVGANATTFSR